ncbi:MAG: hypothetical protein F6K58_05720 [Symploca sp. SIO2E9]|nr:hypothetical protein [Symploca sp. SIO2E9]
MITDREHWFRALFRFRGSVIPAIYPRVLLCAILGLIISLLHELNLTISWSGFGSVISNFAVNLVLGLLLVFRTNTAYERFLEGRKAWGVIVVNARNLSRQITVAVEVQEAEDTKNKAANLRLLSTFAIATMLHLRNEPINAELEALLTPSQAVTLKSVKIPPLEIALWIGDYLQKQQHKNCLSLHQLTAMNLLLDDMVGAVTTCERIKNTPIPLAYAIHLKQLILIYCLSLPFQVVGDLSWWTGPSVALISFALLGIEEIGLEIENPFGHDPNDLPLEKICRTITNNIDDLIATNLNMKI